MTLTITIPDELASSLQLSEGGGERRLLEALALEGYREGRMSRSEVGELIGLGYFETEAFLQEHAADYGLTPADLRQDAEELQRLLDES